MDTFQHDNFDYKWMKIKLGILIDVLWFLIRLGQKISCLFRYPDRPLGETGARPPY